MKDIKFTLFLLFIFSSVAMAQQSEDDKMNIAYDKYMEGEFHAAIQDFTIIIKNNPRNAEALFIRGICLSNIGSELPAIEDFTKALSINPRYKEAYLERAYSKNNVEDFDGALADYGKALEIDPDYAEAYLNRGTLYYELDRDADACKDWRKAMNLGFKIAEQVVEANCKECNPR